MKVFMIGVAVFGLLDLVNSGEFRRYLFQSTLSFTFEIFVFTFDME